MSLPIDVQHPLGALFADIVRGVYPPVDCKTETTPRPGGVVGAVLAFTGHHIVAADVDPAWVAERCPEGDLLTPLSPGFLLELQHRIGGTSDALDVVFCGPALSGGPDIAMRLIEDRIHPRVLRALRMRQEVRVYETPEADGVLTLGRGLAGRWEASFEVAPDRRARGLGRALVAAARHLIPANESIFMQVAAGNIASSRAVLAGGLIPVGAELLYHEHL